VHAVESTHETAREWFFVAGSPFGWSEGGYWPALLRRLLITGPSAIFFSPALGFVPLIAVAVSVARGARGAWDLPSVWLGSLILAFDFGSASLSAYRPLVLFDRYLHLLVLPGVIVIGVAIDQLLARRLARPRPGIGSHGAAWLLVSMIACAPGLIGPLLRGPESQVERRLTRRVSPGAGLFTDARTASVLDFFWGYPTDSATRDFEGATRDAILPGSLVLIHRGRAQFLHDAYGYHLPEFFAGVPDDWTLEWSHGPGALYRVPESSDAGTGQEP
jgi:hypothetical protein